MKILGIGVDIIENRRIRNSIKDSNFRNRIYSPNELKQSLISNNKINYLSKRFAAKEALAKALGTGFRNGLNLKDIEVLNNKHGKPYYNVSTKLKNLIKKKKKIKKFKLFLSISDEKEYSIAFTIIQSIK